MAFFLIAMALSSGHNLSKLCNFGVYVAFWKMWVPTQPCPPDLFFSLALPLMAEPSSPLLIYFQVPLKPPSLWVLLFYNYLSSVFLSFLLHAPFLSNFLLPLISLPPSCHAFSQADHLFVLFSWHNWSTAQKWELLHVPAKIVAPIR